MKKSIQLIKDDIDKSQSQIALGFSLESTQFENKSDSELEEYLAKIEETKLAINKILSERKKETCVICLSQPRTHVLIPCGHKLFCGGCAGLLAQKNCPICRVEIQSTLKVFG